MMKIDPGAIGFTSGFSQEHKYFTVGMVAVLRKIQGGLCVKERIIPRDLNALMKFAPTLEVRNDNAQYQRG